MTPSSKSHQSRAHINNREVKSNEERSYGLYILRSDAKVFSNLSRRDAPLPLIFSRYKTVRFRFGLFRSPLRRFLCFFLRYQFQFSEFRSTSSEYDLLYQEKGRILMGDYIHLTLELNVWIILLDEQNLFLSFL